MADIRIKDLATTATTTASDDFMAVDGAINGTRKLSAATPAFLTSVTTPSLTSPAATPLTLGLGTGGTALTLADTTLAATFAGNVTVSGITGQNIFVALGTDNNGDALAQIKSTGLTGSSQLGFSDTEAVSGKLIYRHSDNSLAVETGGTERARFTSTGLAVTGAATISSTTAGSSSAGALIVQGGISVGNTGSAASYFGGAVTAAGTGAFGGSGSLGSTYLSRLSVFAAGGGNFSVGGQTNTDNTVVARMTAYNASNGNSGNESSTAFMGIASIESVVKTATGNAGTDSGGDLVFLTKGDGGTLTERMRLLSTGAATFAGAVAIGNTVNSVSPTSPNRTITMVVGGVTLYIAAKTTND